MEPKKKIKGRGSMWQHQDREAFSTWLDNYAIKDGMDVPARLVAVMALLERLRESPILQVSHHEAPSGIQLKKHNRYVALALKRCQVNSPVAELGRRSCNLHGWIGPLLAWLESKDFTSASGSGQEEMLTGAQLVAAERLQIINESKPLIARYNKGTVRAIITDILDQAQEKKKAKDVAEYLVGAKLQLRLGEDAATPKNVNTPNRNEPSDFRVGNAAIEVTVNSTDTRHLAQVKRILTDTTLHVWVLVRLQDREKWQALIDEEFTPELAGRVVIADIETFVGQNVSELGGFNDTRITDTLSELFRVYNERWLPEACASGLSIVSGDPNPK
jgi:hypothetical protein